MWMWGGVLGRDGMVRCGQSVRLREGERSGRRRATCGPPCEATCHVLTDVLMMCDVCAARGIA